MSVEPRQVGVGCAALRGAVFLSYASQDAGAAKKICDALRAAGIEVWFDQSELRGGDAWDQKIRKQIKECALFVPIISANTQQRQEGYFRLEWHLAEQRSHLIARGRPFIVPVCVDTTTDSDALVPDAFLAVQWMRLPEGAATPAFGERIKVLLGGPVAGASPFRHAQGPEPVEGLDDARGRAPGATLQGRQMEAGHPRPAEHGGITPKSKRWLVPVVTLIAVASALAFWQPWKKSGPIQTGTQPSTLAQPVAQQSEARKLAMQAQALIDDPNFTRENYRLADELCQRALTLDASDAEVWAVAAFVSEDMITESYDESARRQGLARTQSERAVRLDPRSIRAGLAVAKNLRLSGDLPEGIRRLRELTQRAPADRLVLRELARSERKMGNDAGVQEVLTRLQALPGGDPRTVVTEAKDLRNSGRLPEAEALDDQLLATTPVRLAYYEKLLVLALGWSDLTAAASFIEKIPADLQHEDAFGSLIAQIWIWQGKGDKALEALGKVPHDYLEEFAARGPKAYLTGWAQKVAGRPMAAQAEWQSALDLTETRLAADPMNLRLLGMKAGLEALLGRKDAARSTWKLRVELGGTVNQAGLLEAVGLPVLLGETQEAIAVLLRRWAAMEAGLRGWYFSSLRYAPEFAPIRDDPRVQHLIAEQIATLSALRRRSVTAQPAVVQADQKSVAVLAFDNLSDDKANEYFADGISEELLNALGKVAGLKVTARTSAFSFKGRDVPVPEIARQLGVAYVVEGSVRKQGDRVRIVAQLVKAADGFQVWSDQFDRELKDIFAVQDEIAAVIARNLSLKMGVTAPTAATANPAVFQLYAEARQLWNVRSEAALDRMEQLLTRALQLDPHFAPAEAGLAQVWVTRAFVSTAAAPDEATELANAVAHATKAIALDPTSAEAFEALGTAALVRGELAGAETAITRAVTLNPNYATGWNRWGWLLARHGRVDEAVDKCARGREIDPLAWPMVDNYGLALMQAGRAGEAIAVLAPIRAMTDSAPVSWANGAVALMLGGRNDEALAVARVVTRGGVKGTWSQGLRDWSDGLAAWVLAEAGARDEARVVAERLLAGPPARRFAAGFSLVALGREDEGCAVLASMPQQLVSYLWLLYQRHEPLADVPRFQQLLRQLNATADFEVARETLARLRAGQATKR